MGVRAVGAWVLLEPDPPVRQTQSGLFLPEGNLEERKGYLTATVKSVGSGKISKKGVRVKPFISPGDRVLFRGYLQELWRPEGSTGKICLIHIDDVMGVLE